MRALRALVIMMPVVAAAGVAMFPAPSMARSKAKGSRATALVQRLSLDLQGNLKEDAVAKVIRRGMVALRACYQRGLKRNALLTGKLTLTIGISSTGRVTYVETVGGEWDARVNSCIKVYPRRWRFPAPGTDTKVSVGFVFRRMTKPPPVPRWPETGVPECDHHIRNYLTCLYTYVSAATRTDIVKRLKPDHDAWRETARAPERRPQLVKTCQAAARKAQKVFDVYGCVPVK